MDGKSLAELASTAVTLLCRFHIIPMGYEVVLHIRDPAKKHLATAANVSREEMDQISRDAVAMQSRTTTVIEVIPGQGEEVKQLEAKDAEKKA